MKLIRFGEKGAEKPGVLIGEERKDCSGHFADWNHDFFQQNGLEQLSALLAKNAATLPPVAKEARWAPCIARPGKTVCIGLNYRDHAHEMQSALPTEPTIFFKATTAIAGAFDNIVIPKKGFKVDWEIELGVILKNDVRYLENAAQAKNVIAGYTISHDVSERAFQKEHGGQWVKGKSCDTFNPVGPYLLTADEITDIQNLAMHLTVNNTVRQNGSTKDMIFPVYHLIHYLSQFMTLEAGDLISTGTPAGVGMGMQPPVYLKNGDEVTLEIDQLGKQHCRVVEYAG